MNKPDPSLPAAQPPKATKAKEAKRVEYKVKLSAEESAQLIAVRDNCRTAGIRVSKAKLLRAAVVLMNQQSSFKIGEGLQALAPLKLARKKKDT